MLKRGRGSTGEVPSQADIRLARGKFTQADCARLIYTTGVRWSNYENGKSRMHPCAWELFKIKKGIIVDKIKAAEALVKLNAELEETGQSLQEASAKVKDDAIAKTSEVHNDPEYSKIFEK